MDETAVTTKPAYWINNRKKATEEKVGGDGDGYSVDVEECDGEAWDTLSRSFLQAQSVLDQNRELIEEVNSNHESKIPDNVAKNVGLIRQINGNISKVLSIYSDLSTSFSNIVHQQRGLPSDAVNSKNRDSDTMAVEDSPELVAEKSEMVELMAAGLHSYIVHPQCNTSFAELVFNWGIRSDEAEWLVDLFSTWHFEGKLEKDDF